MPRKCAFCPTAASLSGEHLWSAWMGDLFPGDKRFTNKNETGKIVSDWHSSELNWKAKVVCRECNNTWMSAIENDHAKPAMSDLIRGVCDVAITESRALSIALFAFKTAVVFDYMQKTRQPFFSHFVCDRFREALDIPPTVAMWIAGFVPSGKGNVHTCYHEGKPHGKQLELYVCTYSVGHFAFQVMARRCPIFFFLSPWRGFEGVAIPLWPCPQKGFVWPASEALQTVSDFDQFSLRWQRPELHMLAGAPSVR